MDTAILGRTGIEVSAVGLGAGGPSRIGKSLGLSEAESIRVVQHAYDGGITLFDTSEAYHTEDIIGKALGEIGGDDAVISTKLRYKTENRLKNAAEIETSIDESLKKLGRDVIDIYHVHGVAPDLYEGVFQQIYPLLDRMRGKGKVRSIGITEMFGQDRSHTMLSRALQDNVWDVIMVGFSMLNFSARRLFEQTRLQKVGVLDMFAVRRALRDLHAVRSCLAEETQKGVVDSDVLDKEDPFGFALNEKVCETVPELAYRFARHDPGIDVVLTGTSSIEHLRENIASMEKPPLPPEVLRRIEAVFDGINSISGN